MHLFQFSLHDQARNWLKRLPAGSITTWEDLATHFFAQFFPPGRTVKLRNDILMFQQHHGESLPEAWTRFKDLLQKVHHHGIDHWLQIQFFYDHVSFHLKCEIELATCGKLLKKNADESWEIIENLALYDHEGWNDTKEFFYLSLAREEEERSDKIDVATGNDIEKPTRTEMGMQANEAKKKNEAGKEEMTEVPSSQPISSGMGRNDKTSPREGDEIQPMKEQKFQKKAYLLKDKQIPSVGVFDEVFSIWKAFGGNTRNLGSFGEETDKTTNQHQNSLRFKVLAAGDGVTIYTRRHHTSSIDGVTTFLDGVSQHQLNSYPEDSTL
ncbi:zinc finger, CCHC-type containing protein [Tanacetum coccineum]